MGGAVVGVVGGAVLIDAFDDNDELIVSGPTVLKVDETLVSDNTVEKGDGTIVDLVGVFLVKVKEELENDDDVAPVD